MPCSKDHFQTKNGVRKSFQVAMLYMRYHWLKLWSRVTDDQHVLSRTGCLAPRGWPNSAFTPTIHPMDEDDRSMYESQRVVEMEAPFEGPWVTLKRGAQLPFFLPFPLYPSALCLPANQSTAQFSRYKSFQHSQTAPKPPCSGPNTLCTARRG